jgi:hypothetical protein
MPVVLSLEADRRPTGNRYDAGWRPITSVSDRHPRPISTTGRTIRSVASSVSHPGFISASLARKHISRNHCTQRGHRSVIGLARVCSRYPRMTTPASKRSPIGPNRHHIGIIDTDVELHGAGGRPMKSVSDAGRTPMLSFCNPHHMGIVETDWRPI